MLEPFARPSDSSRRPPEPAAAKSGTWLARFGLVAAAIYTRWMLADLEPWGVDEAVNLWLGAEMLAGRGTAFGLVSSMGTPQLAGAPLVAAPLTLLPDLRSASMALSLIQLLAWVPLANAIGRSPGERTIALGFFWFHPAPLFVSFAMWGQYLTVTTGALLAALLLRVAGGDHRAAFPFAVLALLQPAIHFVHLTDLFVQLSLLLWLTAGRPIPTAATSRCSRLVLLVPLGGLWATGLALSLEGAQIATRLLAPRGFDAAALWTAQAVLAVLLIGAALASASRMRSANPDRAPRTGAPDGHLELGILLFGLSSVGRVVTLAAASGGWPSWPWLERPDLWVSLTPAMLASLLLLAGAEGRVDTRRNRVGLAVAVGSILAFATLGPTNRYREATPFTAPQSEMTTVADWIGARTHGSGIVDVSYEATPAESWIREAPRPRWYTIGRAMDWLLRRRHDLRSAADGAGDPPAGARFEVGYRAGRFDRDAGCTVEVFDRLEIRRPRDGSCP